MKRSWAFPLVPLGTLNVVEVAGIPPLLVGNCEFVAGTTIKVNGTAVVWRTGHEAMCFLLWCFL